MADEIVRFLAPRAGGLYVDATLGDGGHAAAILEASAPDGTVLGLDWDAAALERARANLAGFGERLIVRRTGFAELEVVADEVGWGGRVDGVVIDLGVSNLQLRTAARGFSFAADGPLDMRMDDRLAESAADLVAGLSERDLADLIYRYGEERASRRIARQIVARRAEAPITTTRELREAVVAAGVKGRPGHDPATRTFQGLRIAVNAELDQLARVLDNGYSVLAPGGRMAILSYHSLEDRMVKQAFRRWAADCLCPPRHPVCNCGWHARVRLVRRKRMRASAEEVERNPSARSAGLRIVERLRET